MAACAATDTSTIVTTVTCLTVTSLFSVMQGLSVVHDRLIHRPDRYLNEAQKILGEVEMALSRLKEHEGLSLLEGSVLDGGRSACQPPAALKAVYSSYVTNIWTKSMHHLTKKFSDALGP